MTHRFGTPSAWDGRTENDPCLGFDPGEWYKVIDNLFKIPEYIGVVDSPCRYSDRLAWYFSDLDWLTYLNSISSYLIKITANDDELFNKAFDVQTINAILLLNDFYNYFTSKENFKILIKDIPNLIKTQEELKQLSEIFALSFERIGINFDELFPFQYLNDYASVKNGTVKEVSSFGNLAMRVFELENLPIEERDIKENKDKALSLLVNLWNHSNLGIQLMIINDLTSKKPYEYKNLYDADKETFLELVDDPWPFFSKLKKDTEPPSTYLLFGREDNIYGTKTDNLETFGYTLHAAGKMTADKTKEIASNIGEAGKKLLNNIIEYPKKQAQSWLSRNIPYIGIGAGLILGISYAISSTSNNYASRSF